MYVTLLRRPAPPLELIGRTRPQSAHRTHPARRPHMHKLSLPPQVVERVTRRAGRPHPFDVIEPAKTALVVVDMQNYFMKQGFQGEVPMAREIVPNVNRFAAAVRGLGGRVVWIKNATN